MHVGDLGPIPGMGRSPGEGKGTHSSILAYRILQSIAKSQPRLIVFHFHQKLGGMEQILAQSSEGTNSTDPPIRCLASRTVRK